MGGVETHCEELFPRLAAMGYDVTVIRRSSYVRHSVDERSGVKNGMWKGVRLLDLKSPRLKAFEAIIHTTKAVLMARWLGADIVHVHAIGPALVVPLARMFGLKVVFTHHGPDYDRDKWGGAAKLMLRMGQSCGCRFANHVIVISEVIKELIADVCGRKKNVHLIYNGVPVPEICHEKEYFESLGIEEGKYILGMCRFVPEKHLHDLVEAYKKVQDSLIKADASLRTQDGLRDSNTETPQGIKPPKALNNETAKGIKLVLAGDTDFEDDYSRSLKKMARDNGVVLTGFVRGTKLHSLLSNALCYSLPSSHEGLPIALLEAMSYRLPVITSSIPANLEVGLDPECYHKVGDVDALADKLAKIIDAPLQRVDYDMSRYNWDIIAQQVSEVYESL